MKNFCVFFNLCRLQGKQTIIIMKTFHVNLRVNEIKESVRFYTALFDAKPTVNKSDYAKWNLADPKVNFSISLGKNKGGLNHLGIQVESKEELRDIYANITKADATMVEEGHTVCCYAESEKSWVMDPQEVKWEAFHTYGESDVNKKEVATSQECCEPSCCS